MQSRGLTAVEIAQQLGCSASFVYKRLANEGLGSYKRFSTLADASLDEKVSDVLKNHSNAGVEVRCSSFFVFVTSLLQNYVNLVTLIHN